MLLHCRASNLSLGWLHHPPSTIHQPPSIHHSPSIYHPPSTHHPPTTIHHPSTIHHLSPTIHHPCITHHPQGFLEDGEHDFPWDQGNRPHSGRSFSFFKLIYFSWRKITLQYCNGYELVMGTHIPPILNAPPTFLPTPSLWVVSECQLWELHALNLHWSSILHMIIYMFKCYSLKSSHPFFLPQSPKVCSLHLCLFCCLAYRVVVTIFLNSIGMC